MKMRDFSIGVRVGAGFGLLVCVVTVMAVLGWIGVASVQENMRIIYTDYTVAAMDLAQQYGRSLHTGILYRNPDPPPTIESLVRERQQTLAGQGVPRERIFDRFLPR